MQPNKPVDTQELRAYSAGMDIAALKMFVAVAQRRSFAAVAREFDADPSTISRTIANLEEELGLRLFQRTTRSVTLTEGGEKYLSRIEALVEDLDIAREEALTVIAQPKGIMRITASIAFGQYCLTPLLPAMRAKFPGLRFELILTDLPVDLVSERIDLAIRLGDRVRGNVVSTKLFDNHYRVCASPGYIKQHDPVDRPQDLLSHSCLMMRPATQDTNWIAQDSAGRIEEIPVRGDVVISSVMALRQCALDGLGPVMLAGWMIDKDIRSGRLVELLPSYRMSGAHARKAAWLIYPSKRYLPLKSRVTFDFVKNALAHLGGGPAP